MKKSSKKVAFILIMAIISTIFLTVFTAHAVPETEISDVHYSYEGMTAEKAEQIVKAMFGIPDDTLNQRTNSSCSSHIIKTGSIITTEHNASSTSPRCKVTTNSVEYCDRSGCSYYKVTGERVNWVSCH